MVTLFSLSPVFTAISTSHSILCIYLHPASSAYCQCNLTSIRNSLIVISAAPLLLPCCNHFPPSIKPHDHASTTRIPMARLQGIPSGGKLHTGPHVVLPVRALDPTRKGLANGVCPRDVVGCIKRRNSFLETGVSEKEHLSLAPSTAESRVRRRLIAKSGECEVLNCEGYLHDEL